MSDDVPPTMKQVLVKPLSREVRKWNKAVRSPVGFGGPGCDGGGRDRCGAGHDTYKDVEGEAFTQVPLQTLLMQLVQKDKTISLPCVPANL